MTFPSKRMVEGLQRRVSEGFYSDTAIIVYRTLASRDTAGQPVYTTSEVSVSCSFNEKPKEETWKNIGDFEQLSAEVRFVGTKPTKGDLVTLVHRFNRGDSDSQNYDGETYEIIGIMDRDAFGYICALKKVQL